MFTDEDNDNPIITRPHIVFTDGRQREEKQNIELETQNEDKQNIEQETQNEDKQNIEQETQNEDKQNIEQETQDEDKQNKELPFCLYKSEIVLTAIIKGSIVHTALKFNVLC